MKTLIVFTRYPVPGQTKTRLIPALGPEGAARLQKEMTELALRTARRFCSSSGVSLQVRFDGGSTSEMRCWTGPALEYKAQGAGSLGDRLKRAVKETSSAGTDGIVIIGVDCPFITESILTDAFNCLDSEELVLGPAADGGYYLIGLRGAANSLFEEIDWGTEKVLNQTTTAADRANLSYSLLEELNDIDRPEDVELWSRIDGHAPGRLISVVIPALNEESQIANTVKTALCADDVEVIVADGGSTDATVSEAEKAGAQIVNAPRGRGAQMNAGAAEAKGDMLLFLHADTKLPSRYDDRVRETLAVPTTCAGAFSIEIDGHGRWLRANEAMINFRSKYRSLPYGDQALFMRRTAFTDLGGFPEISLMEDYALVEKLRRLARLTIVDATVSTSARRWSRVGPVRTTITNWMIIAGYHLGISPEKLAKLYRKEEASA